ncbi:MAG: PqqD family protein [Bacteroidales bacterium]|nr:PqqD family protein [Bacteroidales bacterium]MBR5907604.1 PqqD family protein [Bacteroidales bacterium]
MKIKTGFKLRTIVGEHIITGEGVERVNFNKIITLNETAVYLWENLVGKEFTEDDVVKLLTDEYEVTEEVARKDVQNLLSKWEEAGLLDK